MFEKSLYDLIRGLRNHKGSEKEYIADSIKECRQEIRSNDMDLKSTALMKLTYLEMFGHDMSWASFNVLEVMSSPKFRHKRTGYLAAVQSFRRDTEVLVLAENQLKKLDGGAFEATAESGFPIYSTSTSVQGAALEASNTDISEEFSKLIVTQQAYSANSRIISTSADMLREALDMVR